MSETSIKVKSIKVAKGGESARVWFEESGDSPAEIDRKCKNPCHPDLVAALQALVPHLAIMTEYVQAKNVGKASDLQDKFVITGYSIGGKTDEEGIVITGYRRTGKGIVTLNTPFCRFDEDPKTRYILMDELEVKLKPIEREISAYLKGEKKGTKAQGELDMDDDGSEQKVVKMQVAKPALPGEEGEDENDDPNEVVERARRAWGNGEEKTKAAANRRTPGPRRTRGAG
jgi:hypothetical protein